MDEYIVYVLTDERGVIIAVNSSAFVSGEGWTEADRGSGDRFHHAQGHYLPLPLLGDDGVYRYKLAEGAITERTEEELEADRAAMTGDPLQTLGERVGELEDAFETLMTGETDEE